ncbi:MAG: V-type ATPase subunit [Clostridiales bacterium]|nr:V-type ATPase subunit [Clostridiales bacterium]
MGSVLSYSGLATKIRAMQSRLITDHQLEEIVQLPDVPQVAAYLKKTPEYANLWTSLDENSLHREQLENLLRNSIFQNFSRLYHFAGQEQRVFLELYSTRYEIRLLKKIMASLFDHRNIDPVDISPYRDFFRLHSKLDMDRLTACPSMEEFVHALKGSEFYSPLAKIQERGTPLLFDYGMALDLSYFSRIWKMRKRLFTGNDQAEITKVYGEKFDLLNLQFIQRSKVCYHMESTDIYALLIPVNYRLKKEEIRALTECETEEEAAAVFDRTWYGDKYRSINGASLEEFYNLIMRTLLEREARKDPWSIAVIHSYLYHKEHEVNRLIIALECVRYGVEPGEAMRYIHSN